jgi:tRNA_anti-like
MHVSALKLALDYHANEVQADNVYRGKHLLVTGFVTSISKDALDNVYLVLASENEFMQVHANLQESEAGAAANLHTMQLVHVDCVGGEMVIGSPQLNNCTIVPDEPVAAPPAPSEPQANAEPSPSDESSKPTLSGPATGEATGTSKDSADADSSSGDTHEGQTPPQQPTSQEGQAPQQPPAPIERH